LSITLLALPIYNVQMGRSALCELVAENGSRGSRMNATFLPYGRHLIEDDDIAAVVAVLKGDWLTTGPSVQAFENRLAHLVGAKYAIACNSGTAALHMAAAALGLGHGDVVIVPSVTFLASANGPHFTGADIMFADVDPATGLLTPETLAAALKRAGGKAKAAVCVHLNGQSCDLNGLRQVTTAASMHLIEDACHALGTTYRPSNGDTVLIGACRDSDLACFSFHPVKTIAMGEGGAVTTNDAELANRLRLFRNHGIVRNAAQFEHTAEAFAPDGTPNPWYYEMPEPGFNYRASDLNCALGLSQLTKLNRFIVRRKELVAVYDDRFRHFPEWIKPVPIHSDCDPAPHIYVLSIDFTRAPGQTRGSVMRALAEKGIGTQVHYLPVHRQPYYRRRCGALTLPGADAYYDRALTIPLYPAMTISDVNRVVDGLAAVLGLRNWIAD
jgi:UDP-4-amino-4,6-dideoxy-N-acetyl-beta-L-altrosamine transaminase